MSDVLMLNKKRSIICSLIPESPIGSPSHLGSPYWLPTLLQLLFLNF